MDVSSLRRAARSDCSRSTFFRGLVVKALCESMRRPGSGGCHLLRRRAASLAASAEHGEGISQFHRAGRLTVCCVGRHSHQHQGRSHAVHERCVSGDWRAARKRAWYDGRFNAADPPVAAHEQIPRDGAPRRIFYFYHFERWWVPHAGGRSTVISRLSARGGLLVGGEKRLVHLADSAGDSAGDVLPGRCMVWFLQRRQQSS